MYLFRANGDANFGLRSDNGIPARRREEQLRAEENVRHFFTAPEIDRVAYGI